MKLLPTPGAFRVVTYYTYADIHIHQRWCDFRWYWSANAYSWFMHHVMGYGCNTYRRKT